MPNHRLSVGARFQVLPAHWQASCVLRPNTSHTAERLQVMKWFFPSFPVQIISATKWNVPPFPFFLVHAPRLPFSMPIWFFNCKSILLGCHFAPTASQAVLEYDHSGEGVKRRKTALERNPDTRIFPYCSLRGFWTVSCFILFRFIFFAWQLFPCNPDFPLTNIIEN